MDEIAKLTQELETLQIKNKEAELELMRQIRAKTLARTNQRARRTDGPTDRRGHEVTVGARVTLLTTGLYRGNTGVVTRLGKERATIELESKKTTNLKNAANAWTRCP